MPHHCQYCGTDFRRKCDLSRHQRTAKYCLDFHLGNNDEKREREIHECECGIRFTRKHSLLRHQQLCGTITVTVDEKTTELITVEPINKDNKTNDNDDSKLLDRIGIKIAGLLTTEIIEKGIAHMMAHIIPLFRNEQNYWVVRVADSSRNRLAFLDGEIEVSDNKGRQIAGMIRNEFVKAVIVSLSDAYKHDDKGAITKLKNIALDLKDDTESYSLIMRELISFLPCHFGKHDIGINNLSSSLRELESLINKHTEKENDSSSLDGFIYIIREREFIRLEENVFKIGRTGRPVGERLCEYPKGSMPYYFEKVNNCQNVEQLLLNKLISVPHQFKHRKDIGYEYFEGNIDQLISIVKSVTQK
jgi:T5orf172 domain